MADHLIAEKFRILIFHSQSVIFFLSIPLLQLNHHVNRLRIFYALNTKQSLYINDTYSAKFNKMPGDIRRGTNNRLITDTADLNHIVADKAVPLLINSRAASLFPIPLSPIIRTPSPNTSTRTP